MPPDPMCRLSLVGLMPRKEGIMEIGQAGMAVVVFLTTVSVVGAVLTAVVTQWDM
jgi:hypothetical protein